MMDFFISRIHSFGHAFCGLGYVLRTQKNAYIHSLATILVICIALWLRIPASDFAILILTIGTVWTAEFINTSLEAVVDLASPEKHPLAKVGKDVGAAAVLIAAMSSVIIGLIILGPALLRKLGY
ncbi:diacylglycerol kinase family protein [Leptolinea tardivitalis]|nr:diacylglycerol kinase family protein [Leptolinea tardivitalis]GAP22947.1 diacylglycerol kinase [Leptolinea tardivitalis]